MKTPPLRRALPALAAAFVLLADQAAKAAALRWLADGPDGAPRPFTVAPGFFDLRLVLNRGAAWGMLAGRRLLLCGVSAAMLAVLWANRRELLRTRLSSAASALLAGGIAGNLVDRLLRGEVVDMLDFHWGASAFPTFNLADAAISVGVGLLLLSSLPCFRTKR